MADELADLPHDERIRSRKLVGGIATLIVDATGLAPSARERVEHELRSAVLSRSGVGEARIAMTASEPSRTLIAVGSG